MCLESHGEVGIWEADKSQIANDQAPPTVLSLNTSLQRELLFLIKNKDLMTHHTKNNKLENSPHYIFWKKHKSQLVNR